MKGKNSRILSVLLALALVVSMVGVMGGGAAAQGSLQLDFAQYAVGDTVQVTSVVNTVTAKSTTDPTGITVILPASGSIFQGTFTLGAASVPGTTLAVAAKDTVTVSHSLQTVTATVVSVDIEQLAYKIGDAVKITVFDSAKSAAVADTITIKVKGVLDAVPTTHIIDVVLTETGATTGTYTGTVTLVKDDVVSPGAGQVKVDKDAFSTLTATYGKASDTAKVDPLAPTTTIDVPAHGSSVTTRTVALSGTYMDGAGETGVVKVELSTDGGTTWQIVFLSGLGTAIGPPPGAWSTFFTAPNDGTFTVMTRATDAVGNVEVIPTSPAVGDNRIQVNVDSVKPALTGAALEREEKATTAGKEVVAAGITPTQTVEAKVTVSDATSGIPVTVNLTWDVATQKWVAAVTTSNVTLDATGLDPAAVPMTLTPEAAILDPVVATKTAALDTQAAADLAAVPSPVVDIPAGTAGGAAIDGDVDLDDAKAALNGAQALVIKTPGVWSRTGVAVTQTAVGTYDGKFKATDAALNVSDTVTASVVVAVDTTDPTISSATVTYNRGVQALRTADAVANANAVLDADNEVLITAMVTDDLSGVNGVRIKDATALTGSAGSVNVALTQDATDKTKWTKILIVGPSVTIQDYTLTVEALDKVGTPNTNSATTTVTVSVVESLDTFRIALAKGWNLISAPKPLVDPSIPAVFDGVPVTRVATFQGGVASVAVNTAGTWDTSLLSTIEDGKGYLVEASEATSVVLRFGVADPLAPPPAYSVPAGWNLVGFSSLTLTKTLDADAYLGSLVTSGGVPTWVVLYRFPGFDQDRPGLVDLPAIAGGEAAGQLALGKGYWLYTSEDTTLIP